MVPMQVALQGDEEPDELAALLGTEPESRFYTCHVCGDNWLSVKEQTPSGACNITFVHQMGTSPVLKRVAHLETAVVVNEDTVDHWDYYLDDRQIDREVWFDKLEERRRILKSICCN
jgi:hypothetical protein